MVDSTSSNVLSETPAVIAFHENGTAFFGPEPERVEGHRYVKLEGRQVQHLQDMTMAREDLYDADRWNTLARQLAFTNDQLNTTMTQSEIDIVSGLFQASVTMYGRVFSQNEGRKWQASRELVDEHFRHLHDQYVDLRNNSTAHAGIRAREWISVFADLDQRDPARCTLGLQFRGARPGIMIESDPTRQLSHLVRHLQLKIDAKQRAIRQALIDHLVDASASLWTLGAGARAVYKVPTLAVKR